MSGLITFGLGAASPLLVTFGLDAVDFQQALLARLSDDTNLTDLVSDRIYPLAVPQSADSTQPTLVYAITSAQRTWTLTGAAGLATVRVHFDARAKTYAECKQIQEVLRQYDGFQGVLGGSVTVLFARLDDHADTFEWPDDASDRGIEHLTMTYLFKYRESLPTAPTP